MPEPKIVEENEQKKTDKDESDAPRSNDSSSSSSIPCMDRLREELSCAVSPSVFIQPILLDPQIESSNPCFSFTALILEVH